MKLGPFGKTTRGTKDVLPAWVYSLVNAVDEYEEQHSAGVASWACFKKHLNEVPQEQVAIAKAMDAYLKSANR